MREHPLDRIGAYADGELGAAERQAVEAHLRACTECTRELALIRTMGGAMREALDDQPATSVWGTVQRRIARPVGWLLFVAGVVVWAALAALEWYRERSLTLEWLAATAVGIGLALLFVGVASEQYREWKDTPYKDVQR
jgi:anti-sigma factor RsiW